MCAHCLSDESGEAALAQVLGGLHDDVAEDRSNGPHGHNHRRGLHDLFLLRLAVLLMLHHDLLRDLKELISHPLLPGVRFFRCGAAHGQTERVCQTYESSIGCA